MSSEKILLKKSPAAYFVLNALRMFLYKDYIFWEPDEKLLFVVHCPCCYKSTPGCDMIKKMYQDYAEFVLKYKNRTIVPVRSTFLQALNRCPYIDEQKNISTKDKKYFKFNEKYLKLINSCSLSLPSSEQDINVSSLNETVVMDKSINGDSPFSQESGGNSSESDFSSLMDVQSLQEQAPDFIPEDYDPAKELMDAVKPNRHIDIDLCNSTGIVGIQDETYEKETIQDATIDFENCDEPDALSPNEPVPVPSSVPLSDLIHESECSLFENSVVPSASGNCASSLNACLPEQEVSVNLSAWLTRWETPDHSQATYSYPSVSGSATTELERNTEDKIVDSENHEPDLTLQDMNVDFLDDSPLFEDVNDVGNCDDVGNCESSLNTPDILDNGYSMGAWFSNLEMSHPASMDKVISKLEIKESSPLEITAVCSIRKQGDQIQIVEKTSFEMSSILPESGFKMLYIKPKTLED